MADLGWVLLHNEHIASTLNCQWPMEDGSSSTSHLSLQFSTADGQGGPPPHHHTTHVTSILTNGGPPPQLVGPPSTLHMPLQLNCQWLIGGGYSSTLYMPLQLSTIDGQWAWVLLHITTLHMSLQFSTANGGGPPFTSHMSLQLPNANGQWGWEMDDIFHISHPVKVTSSGGWMGGWVVSCTFQTQPVTLSGSGRWGYLPHLTNQGECTSAVKPNWLPLLYASTA